MANNLAGRISLLRLVSVSLVTIIIIITAGCGGGGGGGEGQDTTVARIEVTPRGFLLVGLGDMQVLTAQAYNAAGDPIDAAINWSTNDNAAIGVDASGLAVANDRSGSAQIRASADGVDSMPVLGIVALPAINSLLVSDDQFVDGPLPVDPNAEFDVGYRYQVTVIDEVAAEVGDILIASGETPVAGQAVAVADNGDGTLLVTLELVPIDQIFTELEFDEEFDLADVPIEIEARAALYYDVSRAADGAYEFQPKPGVEIPDSPVTEIEVPDGVAAASAATPTVYNVYPAAVRNNKKYGPFDCVFEGSFPFKIKPGGLPRVSIAPALTPRLKYSSLTGGLQEFSVRGQLYAFVDLDLEVQLALQGKIDCSGDIFKIPVPVTGALAAYISPAIPIGAGFALGGKVEITKYNLALNATGQGTVDMGLRCTPLLPECDYFVDNSDIDANLNTAKVDFPDGFNSQDFTPFLQAFGKAKLSVGSPITLFAVLFDVVQFKGGPKISFDLDTVPEQIQRDNFSLYKLDGDLDVGPATDTLKALNLLGSLLKLKAVTPTVKLLSIELDRSPKADMFTASNANPTIGDSVDFQLDVVAATKTFAGIYDISKVNLYHVADTANPVPVLIADIKPGGSQPGKFTLPWIADRQGGTVFATMESEFLAGFGTLNLLELEELVLDKIELGPGGCSQVAKPIDPLNNHLSGDFTVGSWDAKVPVAGGTVDVTDRDMRVILLEKTGPNTFTGRADFQGLLRSSGSGPAAFDVAGTILPVDQGGDVNLTLTLRNPTGGECIRDTLIGGSCLLITSTTLTLNGNAEVACETLNGFDFRFLTLSGPHSWGDVYSVSRDAEINIGG